MGTGRRQRIHWACDLLWDPKRCTISKEHIYIYSIDIKIGHTILDIVIPNDNPCEYFAMFCNLQNLQVLRLFFPKTSRLKQIQFCCSWASRFPGNQTVLTAYCSSAQNILPSSYILLGKGSQSSRQTQCSPWTYTGSICTGFPRPKAILEPTSCKTDFRFLLGLG